MVKMFSSNKIFESEKKKKTDPKPNETNRTIGIEPTERIQDLGGQGTVEPSKIEKLETERERIRQKSDEITEMGIF